MKKSLFLFVCLVLFACVALWTLLRFQERIPYQFISAWIQGETLTVRLGSEEVKVEVAKTNDELARGLSERTFLPENYGMLFDLGNSQTISFWMQGMNIDLDFIWIKDGRVVGVDRNVLAPRAGQDPEIRQSPGEVTHVLEVSAGWLENVQPGDEVLFLD